MAAAGYNPGSGEVYPVKQPEGRKLIALIGYFALSLT